MANARVTIDPALPLTITVDFQSKHRAGFRLFVKVPGGQWEFLKEGVEDTTTTHEPLPSGSQLTYEFVFFKETFDFKATLVFRQNGVVLPTGTVPVKAAGDALLVTADVDLA